MSSKEQYKDALKRARQINAELHLKNRDLQDALTRANKQILDFRRAIIKAETKKWWQFWQFWK